MSQKELSYVEDIYNHEKMVINVLEYYECLIDDEYKIGNMIKEHKSLLNNLETLLEGEAK